MLPQLEGYPAKNKAREERKTLESGTIGMKGFFWSFGRCWEKKRLGHGVVENVSQNQGR